MSTSCDGVRRSSSKPGLGRKAWSGSQRRGGNHAPPFHDVHADNLRSTRHPAMLQCLCLSRCKSKTLRAQVSQYAGISIEHCMGYIRQCSRADNHNHAVTVAVELTRLTFSTLQPTLPHLLECSLIHNLLREPDDTLHIREIRHKPQTDAHHP
jgi:hypothetical protein